MLQPKHLPWQIGQVERAGGLWKAMFRQLCWSQQVSGKEDVLLATAAINSARNNLARKFRLCAHSVGPWKNYQTPS